ncbi:uncharacterized protein LOC117772275 [Hippoglossus hippoglossus]|uniref:uncharacterized protein LOC117772275 n=1 Tax=Hippoglossus hippoglossus TaxID=8267 RepID=UPI00148E20C1|nr:uncharacterized protein LOC117772275 [Hippoglossus hippoglossus]
MQIGHQVTGRTPLQIPPQPSLPPILQDTLLVRALINPKQEMEGPLQPQTPQSPRACSSPGAAGRSCWSLDMRVAVLLLTLAGAVILLLLYRLLQFRHRLSVARARNALEYHGFYRTATYTLKHPAPPCQDLPPQDGTVPDANPLVQTVITVTPVAIVPLPPPPVASPPPLPLPPPPALHPPSPPLTPPVPAIPLHLPMIHTTPPSPHLSWGACSDADVYSRIGAFRASRLSSLSNLSSQSKVILFEHSSL